MSLLPRHSGYAGVSVLVLAVVLAGCTATTTPVATPSSQAPVADQPAPEPTQAAETGEFRPAQVFGGDCDTLITATELGEIASDEVTLRDSTNWTLEQAGGMRCYWSSPTQSTDALLDLLPSAAVSAASEDSTCTKLESVEAPLGKVWRCEIDHDHNGIRVSGDLTLLGSGSKAKATAKATAFLDLFDERATADQAAPVPIPAADAWSNPVDCEALGAAVDLKPVFNNTPGFEWQRNAYANDAETTPAAFELAGGTNSPGCGWATFEHPTKKQLASGMADSFGASIFGGSAWAQQEYEQLDTAEDVTIDGFDRVIRTTDDSGSSTRFYYLAVDGPNMLYFSWSDGEPGNAGEAARAIADYLNSI